MIRQIIQLVILFLKAVFHPYFTEKDVLNAAESPFQFDFLKVIAGGHIWGPKKLWLPEANPLPYWFFRQKKRIFNKKDKRGQGNT